METRKSKTEDGDMRVESREWGRRGNGDGGMETEPEKRREREREVGDWDRREEKREESKSD